MFQEKFNAWVYKKWEPEEPLEKILIKIMIIEVIFLRLDAREWYTECGSGVECQVKY